jgi:hypothetical protein
LSCLAPANPRLSERARLVPPGVNDTEKAEARFSRGAQLMRLVGSNVDRVERFEAKAPRPHAHLASSPNRDHDVAVAMALEAGETSGRKLEVTQMELHPLAARADDYLS